MFVILTTKSNQQHQLKIWSLQLKCFLLLVADKKWRQIKGLRRDWLVLEVSETEHFAIREPDPKWDRLLETNPILHSQRHGHYTTVYTGWEIWCVKSKEWCWNMKLILLAAPPTFQAWWRCIIRTSQSEWVGKGWWSWVELWKTNYF